MPQGEAILNNNRRKRFPGKTEGTDSGVGEDEVQEADFNFTEFNYYREMEIFHSAVNEKYLSNNKPGLAVDNAHRTSDTISGGLRRSGWLSMKHILICGRNGRMEQASHRKWKNYWVILKDDELNLYQCDEKEVGSLDMNSPSVVVKIDGCLAQAIPEHVKLENVFGLSTKHGDAFYFQGSSQSEVEGWISSIHSASAAKFAGGKEQTKRFLTSKLQQIQENIDSDCKLKKMAELQLSVVQDSKSKQVITEQISKWEQNFEKLSLDYYKLQCYLSAISGSSPPNPQHVLGSALKTTKQNMSRLGVFSVTSFHSLICCRETGGGTGALLGTGAKVKRSKSAAGYGRLKSALMSSLKITDNSAATKLREQHSPKLTRKDGEDDTITRDDMTIISDMSDWKQMGNFLRVELPGIGSTVVSMKEDMTFQDVVLAVTNKRQLDPEMYFIMFGVAKKSQIEYYTPQEQAFIEDQNFGVLKMCKKSEYTVQLTKTSEDYDINFGLSLKIENDRMIVSRVLDGSSGHLSGILEGDEILSVNNIEVEQAEDDIIDLQNALAEPFISLRLRSLREEVPEQIRKTTESIISTLVCPPPPRTSSSEFLDLTELIVPPPELDDISMKEAPSRNSCIVEDDGDSVNVLLESAEEVTTFCRQHDFLREIEKHTELSDAEKLRRIISELVDTEKSYLKDVQTLLKRYLEPLRHEKFLPSEEVNSLAENVSQILEFQSRFCCEIQELIDCEEDFKNINEVHLFQNVIYGIGEAFLQYADKFKLYSSFCLTHSRIIHMLHPGSNNALEEFLNARNPKQQHSSKLESYLIKPIQRVLKYPLLLNGMSKLLAKDSDEYNCLNEAISALENVAEHINEMQNITEKFLPIFQELAASNGLNVSDVDVDKLVIHKKVTWLNSPETIKASSLRWSPVPLRKMKNETSVRCFVFPKAVILIQLEKRQKKRDKSSKNSLKIHEEVNFKTLIPISSLTLRDNSWCDKDLFCAWELVDVSSPNGTNGQQETLYLLSSKNSDERNETVRAIKDAVRRSMLEDSNYLSRRKPSIASILSTNSIHLGFPNDPAYLRSRSFSESRRAKSKSLGRQYSISEVEMFGGEKR